MLSVKLSDREVHILMEMLEGMHRNLMEAMSADNMEEIELIEKLMDSVGGELAGDLGVVGIGEFHL
jgi:hypothetical protein